MNGDGSAAYRRARRALWICLTVAVALTGALSATLRAPDSPVTALAVVTLGVLLTVVLALAVRLLLALTGRLVQPADAPASNAVRRQRLRRGPERGAGKSRKG